MSTTETKKALLEILAEGVSRKEFSTAFKAVVESVLKLERQLVKMNKDSMSAIIKEIRQEFANLKRGEDSEFTALQRKVEKTLNQQMKETTKMLKAMQDKMDSVRDGVDGESISQEEVVEMIKQNMPEMPEVEKLDATTIRDMLENLQGEDRLKSEFIDGFKEELEKIREEIASMPRGRGGARGKSYYTTSVDLSSQLDGSTKSFRLPNDTVEIVAVQGTQFPVTFNTSDWTFTGNTLTIPDAISAPAAGQSLMVIVNRQFFG